MLAEPRTTRFTRLVIAVPRLIAEAYGAALVEAGAGAVEERASRYVDRVEILLTLPDAPEVDVWASLAESLYQAFTEQLTALALPPFALRQERLELDVHAAWLDNLTSQRLTERIVLVPTTKAAGSVNGEVRLWFEPQPAFGDGTHVTTHLAAKAVQAHCLSHPGCSVLDIGTGNGVLAMVAAVSGAGSILGIDIDPDAIAAARTNARLNQLESQCQFAETALETLSDRFGLVVANLEPRVQVELFEAIWPRLQPGGTLVLTGFLVEQADAIQELLTSAGFPAATRCEGEGAGDDYALLTCASVEAPP